MLLIAAILLSGTFCQTKESKPDSAKIESAAWIAGRWVGTGLGGDCEEIWTEPAAGTMMGSFRLTAGGKTRMLELCSITEEEGTLILRIRHFDAKLNAMEDKDKPQVFRLINATSDEIAFDGVIFRKQPRNGLTILVTSKRRDGTKRELKFDFTKKPL